MKRIAPWIAVVLVLAVMLPIAAGDWSRETTLELSWLGRAIIGAVFVVGAAVGAWTHARDSSSRFGTAEQINLRERDRSAWLRRGALTAVVLGTCAAAVSAFWVYGIVPHLAGKQTRREGTVQRIIGPGAGSRWCTHFVVVKFERGPQAKMCTEEHGPSRLMPEAVSLKEGDSVVVTFKETVLGVSADLRR